MAKKDKPHYVNNKEFLQAMIEWNKTFDVEKGDEVPPVTNYIAECFMKIDMRNVWTKISRFRNTN